MSRSPVIVNHFGAFHAGALYTFAETVGGAIVTASIDLSTNTLINKRGEIKYRKPVTEIATSEASFASEEIARIMSEVNENGKTEFAYTVIVKNENDDRPQSLLIPVQLTIRESCGAIPTTKEQRRLLLEDLISSFSVNALNEDPIHFKLIE